MKDLLEKIVEYGTYLIVFLTPVLYFGPRFFLAYTTSKTFFFYGMVEFVFVVWLYVLFVYGTYKIPRKSWFLFTPVVIWVLWLTVTSIFGVNPELSFWSSLSRGTGLVTLYHALILSVIIASLVIKSPRYVSSLLHFLLGGAFIVALSVWCGTEGVNIPLSFLEKSKGGGLIGNSSLAAGYIIFPLFLSLFVLVRRDYSRRLRWFSALVVCVVLFSPLFVNVYKIFTLHQLTISARGALLGIVIGMISAGFGWLFLSPNRRYKYLGIYGVVILCGVFIWGVFTLDKTDDLGSRLIFWEVAKHGVSARPILGWGMENYSVVYQKFLNPNILRQSDGVVELWVDRAHNVLWEMGVSGGYLTVLLYLSFLASLFYGIYLSYRCSKINRWQSGILWGLIVCYLIQNLFVFDSVSSYLGLFLLAGLIFGSANASSSWVNKVKLDVSLLNKSCLAGVLLVVLLAGVYFLVLKPCRKVMMISSVVSLPLDKRAAHYRDLLDISPVGDAWEIGKVAEDAYNLYSSNTNKILKDEKLLAYSSIDLESLLSYLEVISQREPLDYRLSLNLTKLRQIHDILRGLQR